MTLTNIRVKTTKPRSGNHKMTDADRVRQLITKEIPSRVVADNAYQNAQKYPDKQHARIEHDKALERVMMAVLKDDTQLC